MTMCCKLSLSSILDAILYLILFTLFVIFYLHGQVTEFIKGDTTFTRTFVKIEDGLTVPSIILCMPGIKENIAEKYRYVPAIPSIFYDKNETYKKFNKTPLDVAEEMSYLLGQDFELTVSFFRPDTESRGDPYVLHLGVNDFIKDGSILVKLIWTISGSCYLLQSNYKLRKNDSPWLDLQIRPKSSYYDSVQQDQKIQLFFASNEIWLGLYLMSYQYLTVPKITVPFDKSIEKMIEVMPSFIQFQNY